MQRNERILSFIFSKYILKRISLRLDCVQYVYLLFLAKTALGLGGLAHLPNTPCVYILIHLPCGHLKLTL